MIIRFTNKLALAGLIALFVLQLGLLAAMLFARQIWLMASIYPFFMIAVPLTDSAVKTLVLTDDRLALRGWLCKSPQLGFSLLDYEFEWRYLAEVRIYADSESADYDNIKKIVVSGWSGFSAVGWSKDSFCLEGPIPHSREVVEYIQSKAPTVVVWAS